MSPEFVTKDSGNRQQFSTGAQRDVRKGKGAYFLLPPYAIGRLAKVYERGAAKYEAFNYLKGMPLTLYVDSALRHLFQFLEGHRDEDHAAQSVFNLLALIETEEHIRRGRLPESLNDLPNWVDRPVGQAAMAHMPVGLFDQYVPPPLHLG